MAFIKIKFICMLNVKEMHLMWMTENGQLPGPTVAGMDGQNESVFSCLAYW